MKPDIRTGGPHPWGAALLSLSKEREPFVNGAEGCVRETRKGVLHDDDPHFSELFEVLKNAVSVAKRLFRHAEEGRTHGALLSVILSRHSLMPSYHPVVALLRPAQTLQLLPVQELLQLPDDLVGHQKATGRQAPALLRPLG